MKYTCLNDLDNRILEMQTVDRRSMKEISVATGLGLEGLRARLYRARTKAKKLGITIPSAYRPRQTKTSPR